MIEIVLDRSFISCSQPMELKEDLAWNQVRIMFMVDFILHVH